MSTSRLLAEVSGTHPWISFELPRFPETVWYDVGRVASALHFLAGMPVLPEQRDRLHNIYLAKGALATTAIEGNTLSEEEALQQVEGKLRLPPSKAYLGVEIQNVVDACNWIAAEVLGGRLSGELTPELICRFNKMVLAGDIPKEADAVPGRLREHNVGVGNVYRAVSAQFVEPLVARLCSWLGTAFRSESQDRILGADVLKAVVAHLYLAGIHPFGDGNGRTARLVEFYILLAAGVPSFTAQLLSNHYNLTRSRYYAELKAASRNRGDILPFVTYALQGLVDGLQEQVADIQAQQLKLAWHDYVRRVTSVDHGPTSRRREMLAVALADSPKPVPRSRIPLLTPDIAAEYGPKGKTSKTVSRDLNALLQRGLLRRTNLGYEANSDEILRLLPDRVSHVRDRGSTP